MVVHDFIRSRKDSWARLQAFLEKARRLSLARVPLDAFREGSSLYRQAVADLAYARMRFPGHPVVKELGQIVGQAHSILYQPGKARSSGWTVFWRRTWPTTVRAAAGPILLATAIFWAGAIAGFFLTAQNPVLERFFVSPPMREAIAAKRLWTESLTRTAPSAGTHIAVNNINVSLLTWALGLTFGIGTVWLLLFNGLMLGAIAAACLRAGMLTPLAEFVVGHGSLELPAIWISAGAGLLMADAMLFPGRYGRREELRLQGRKSVQIIVGIVPLLLIAGAIEAFISPSNAPGAAKALLGLCLGLALLSYIVLCAAAPKSDRVPGPEAGGREGG
ncbi:MAG: stage II sporulation protein M [Paludisphaera borealis]|uniref:stage II sporulation protein M n=1 Tax=Paludisphaera borealis TaxID=1387353 RepID=UPI00284787BF|nr:stage II sporulation protein M [Paludisphaera borealis]MDR3617708.1 stage II sporulation protein M [Paludisphaera borealis]